jgi:hypothetical protein
LDAAAARTAEANTGWRAVPLVGGEDWPRTFTALNEAIQTHRRLWLVTDGTFFYNDPDKLVEAHLQQAAFRVWEEDYFSPNSYLELDLFLPAPPIIDVLPPALPDHPRTTALFGEQILFHGFDVGQRFSDESVIPVTLYWDPVVTIEQRYKYVLELTVADGPHAGQLLARTEREPYSGFLPTLWWRPGPIIQEYSDLLPTGPLDPDRRYELRLTLYDADSLEKLSVSMRAPTELGRVEDRTLVAPFVLQ